MRRGRGDGRTSGRDASASTGTERISMRTGMLLAVWLLAAGNASAGPDLEALATGSLDRLEVLAEPRPMADVTMTRLDGSEVALSDFLGRPFVLGFSGSLRRLRLSSGVPAAGAPAVRHGRSRRSSDGGDRQGAAGICRGGQRGTEPPAPSGLAGSGIRAPPRVGSDVGMGKRGPQPGRRGSRHLPGHDSARLGLRPRRAHSSKACSQAASRGGPPPGGAGTTSRWSLTMPVACMKA